MQLDDQSDEEQDVDMPLEPGTVSGRALPVAMVRRAAGKNFARFLDAPAYCAIVRVRDSTWVEPIADACRAMARWYVTVSGNAKPRDVSTSIASAMQALAAGKRVLVVYPSTLPVPKALVDASDIVLDVTAITTSDLAEAIMQSTGAKVRGLTQADVVDLDLVPAMAAIRVGSAPFECLARIRAAKTKPANDPMVATAPLLQELHGYGEAQRWAERLVADVELWRRGKLDFGAIQRNAVLAGPPGVGKSTFVRSLARSANLPLFSSSIGTMFANGEGYLDSIVKAIDSLFNAARAAGPAAIVFLDEIDGFPSRASLEGRHSSWWTPIVGHLLTTLDSTLSTATANLIVISATNHVERLDPALVRPGRLDRILRVSLPEETALLGILRQHLAGDLDGLDLSGIAALALGSTGADIASYVKGARARARQHGRPIDLQDLLDEICPPSRMSEEDLWRACVHECGHAMAATVLGNGTVMSISVSGNGGGRGGRMVYRPAPTHLDNIGSLGARAQQLLAGRAAEQALTGSVSSGAGGADDSDLAKASALMAAAHLSFGLMGTLVYAAAPEEALSVAVRSNHLLPVLHQRMDELYEQALDLVEEHGDAILEAARHLMRHRIMNGDQFREIVSRSKSELGGRRAG